jgi:hypothetical protein
MEESTPFIDTRKEAIAAMRSAPGKPGAGNGPVATQGVTGAGIMPVNPSPQAQAIQVHARAAADYIEQVGEDADAIGRLYRAECQKLAADFRQATEALMNRLIGLRK